MCVNMMNSFMEWVNLKYISTLFVLLTACVAIMAQDRMTVLQGTVSEFAQGKPLPDINVFLTTTDGTRIFAFTSTDESGKFRFEEQIAADSVRVTVTGFNLETTYRIVPTSIGNVDFSVRHEDLRIREVVVKAEPLQRRGDTLRYVVDAYVDSLIDRSIGDVLKKMPGIEVARGGKIYYNNRPIDRFYIEGMDLMGGRYGVAVDNVRAKDVATVEVLENHQPIKALAGIDFSPDAAINLRLKNRSKGSLISTAQLGVGHGGPWLWNGNLAAMYFTGRWQSLSTVKTNNAGQDIGAEWVSFYDSFAGERSPLTVYMPPAPDTDRERYMDNTTWAVSINNILKLNEDRDHTVRLNASYLHDRQNQHAASLTTYYLPDGPPLEIDETTTVTETTDDLEMKIKYDRNEAKSYLNEQFAFKIKWDDNGGDVLNLSENVNQHFLMRQSLLQNDLHFIKVLGEDIRVDFSSRIYAADLPSNLRVSPVLFPEIFGYEAQEAVQEMSHQKIRADQEFRVTKFFPQVGLDLNSAVSFSADFQEISSRLFDPESISPIPDNMRNEMCYQRFEVKADLGIRYGYRDFHVAVGASPVWSFLSMDDRVQEDQRDKDRLFLNPYLHMDWKITPDLSFLLSATVTGNVGAASDIYSGYLMTDYRQVNTRKGEIAEGLYRYGSAELRYADAIRSLFASLRGSCWARNSNLMYGSEYFGSLSRIYSYSIDNLSYGWGIDGKVEKRLNAVSTTLAIPVSYQKSRIDVLRQGTMMATDSRNLSVGLDATSRLTGFAFLDLSVRYIHSGGKIRNPKADLVDIDSFHQRVGLNFTFLKSFVFNFSEELYFNDAVSADHRSLFFLDASIKYRTHKFEYVLEGRNLMNTTTFSQQRLSDVISYQHNYHLRPFSVMLKVRFSLGA